MKHSFDFALTTYCQAKCRSCARTNEDTGEKESWLELKHMDLNVFEKRLANLKNVELDDIEFCGEFGDPMMHPQVDNFIETALNYAPMVTISTNGGLRTPDWYESIAKKYKQRLKIDFAIDGATHDVNWLYREGVDFERAMNNMKAFTTNGGFAEWLYIIFDWNWQQVTLAKQMANDMNIKIIFRYNDRPYGLITDTNMQACDKLCADNGINIGYDYDEV